jgi:signal transduction histidine kinase
VDSIKSLAEEIAEISTDSYGSLLIDPLLSRVIERRQKYLGLGSDMIFFITNSEGRIIYSRPGLPSVELIQSITIPADQEAGTQKLNSLNAQWYIVKQAIKSGNNVIGSIYVIYPLRDISRNPEEIQFLVLMLGGLGLLGWLIIYTLTRKLAKPIKEVADAAKQIVTGNYDLELDNNVREQEIYELIESFKEMSEQLRQLETLRTELLAGVTHELKTPVTSISGLIQAVKDGVVSGEEAQEFLEICTIETARLQKMVEDLLDFNSFITGDIKVEKQSYNINKLVQEIVYQWMIVQQDNNITINTRVPDQDIITNTDAMRLQQVLFNLINNAQQSFTAHGNIEVILYQQDEEIRIDVSDNGTGITEEEQGFIFERFFRGKDKKVKVHGLGLGLSFSRIIAKALGGDLMLKSSSPEGSTFTLFLSD